MDKINHVISRLLMGIAGAALLAIVMLVTANIIMRQVAEPFGGTSEVVGWLTAIVASLSLAYSQHTKAHVELDIIVSRFPMRVQSVIEIAVAFISLLFFIIVAWRVLEYGENIMSRGSVSQTLRVAYYPFVYIVGIGFAGFCIALASDFIKNVNKVVKQ